MMNLVRLMMIIFFNLGITYEKASPLLLGEVAFFFGNMRIVL